jgi:hypothetical protein
VLLSGKLARVALAAAIPAAAVVMVVGPASASGGGKAKGSVTCDLASSFRFSPPLAPGIGTKGFKQEIVTMGREALSDCTGSVTHGALPTAGAQMGAAKIKIKGLTHVPPGNGKAAGGCPAFLNLAWPKLKANYTWTSSPADAKTKVKVAKGGTWGSNDGLYTLTFSGKAKGSFSGTVAIDAVFDSASSTAFTNCIGGSPGTISTAEFNPSMSTISFTPPA